jgi:hypothetical protein
VRRSVQDVFQQSPLDLRFALQKTLDPRVTFTRASSTPPGTGATYVGSDGVIRTATTNEPRFDHNPTTGESLGLLVEEARTNYLLQSQDFATTWGGANITIASDSTTAPDGTTTADTLTHVTAASERSQTSQSFTAGSAITVSIFAKKNTSDFFRFELGNVVSCWFNLNTGVTGSNQAGSGNVLFSAKSIQPFPNGWYRCVLTCTTSTITTVSVKLFATNTDGNSSSINSSVYLWGAQLEAGAFPTSYIPTTTATVTRAADVASVTGSNFGVTRTNLLLRSEEFNDATWTKTRSSVTANAIASPDGATTADKLVEDSTASNTHLTQQTSSVVSGTTYTFSVFAKAAERSEINIQLTTGFATTAYRVNLNNGSTVSTTGSPIAVSAQALPNGWYRLSLTQVANLTTSVSVSAIFLSVGGTTVYTGNGTSGIYLWGAMLETGSTATAYIPTTTAAVSVFESSWYNQTASTIYSEAASSSGAAYTGYVYTIGADFNNGITHYRQADFQPVARIRNAGADEYGANGNGAIWTGTLANKFSLAVSSTSGRQASNGSLNTGSDDTSISIPTASSMTIGALVGGSNQLNGTIKRLTYWPTRLANTTLQQITQP